MKETNYEYYGMFADPLEVREETFQCIRRLTLGV